MPENDYSPEPQPAIRPALQLPVDAFEVVISDGPDGVPIVSKNHSGTLPGPGRTTEEHQRAVSREREWLRAAKGIDGVVTLVDVDPEQEDHGVAELTTRFAGGQTLRSARLGPAGTAHVLAGVCDTLTQLQQRNLRHGALSPEHIIIASDGSGVLCSPNTSLTPEHHLDDLIGLGNCINFCLEQWACYSKPPVNLTLWLVLAKRLESEDPVMTPRRAATMISDLAETISTETGVGRRSRLVGILLALVCTGALVAVGVSGKEPVTGPQLQVRDALIRVGSAGQVAVALEPPPDCPGAEVYVLDPVSSWVWTFDDVHSSSSGTLLVQVAGATGLMVERENVQCPVVIASGPAGQVQVPSSSDSSE